MWPSTPARHPPAAPVAAPVATAAHNHPALPVIATVSTTEINDAKHAYKDMLRAASDMHIAMRALAQKARDFAAALHDFAHAVPGSVVPPPTVGRGDWSDDDVDDDGAGLGVRKYATLQTLLANGLESSADKLEADFLGKLKTNYAQHKNNIKANAEHYRAARDLHARQTKGLEKAMAESKKGLGANLLSSHRGSFSFSTAPHRHHAATEPADANEKYRETVHELARMATGLEIIKNHHFDSIMAEERRNLTYVSARCAEALALQCDLVWGKAYTFTFNAMEQWRARAPPSPSTLAHAARHHCASPSFGPASGHHHHHHHHRGRSASNATQCAAARIAAACDAAEAGMPALTAIPAAYAGLPPPPHSPAPATPITPGRAGARHRRGMSIATLRETLFPGTAANGQGNGMPPQPPSTPLARPKTPVFVHALESAVSLHHHDGHHHHHRMSGVASPNGSGGRSRSNSMSAVYPAATAPPVVTDTVPDSYDTLVAASIAHDEAGEFRQRKWSVSTGVSVAISEYIVAGPHGGYAVPPMPPLPPTTMAVQR
ncbi:hypothetical protein GGF32_003774 [Allomyces javanicus]|nr:hypothetical protein GGF32_003774 [Allomyces javanicus]